MGGDDLEFDSMLGELDVVYTQLNSNSSIALRKQFPKCAICIPADLCSRTNMQLGTFGSAEVLMNKYYALICI